MLRVKNPAPTNHRPYQRPKFFAWCLWWPLSLLGPCGVRFLLRSRWFRFLVRSLRSLLSFFGPVGILVPLMSSLPLVSAFVGSLGPSGVRLLVPYLSCCVCYSVPLVFAILVHAQECECSSCLTVMQCLPSPLTHHFLVPPIAFLILPNIHDP